MNADFLEANLNCSDQLVGWSESLNTTQAFYSVYLNKSAAANIKSTSATVQNTEKILKSGSWGEKWKNKFFSAAILSIYSAV